MDVCPPVYLAIQLTELSFSSTVHVISLVAFHIPLCRGVCIKRADPREILRLKVGGVGGQVCNTLQDKVTGSPTLAMPITSSCGFLTVSLKDKTKKTYLNTFELHGMLLNNFTDTALHTNVDNDKYNANEFYISSESDFTWFKHVT